MSKIINLRRFSKQKQREVARQKAAENAAKFGRTPEQRQKDEEDARRLKKHLDGHIREDP